MIASRASRAARAALIQVNRARMKREFDAQARIGRYGTTRVAFTLTTIRCGILLPVPIGPPFGGASRATEVTLQSGLRSASRAWRG
jgi:hypothetical protein